MTARGYCLGPVEQIPLGEGRAFVVDGEQVAVFRTRAGELWATGAVCPHAGGPLADGSCSTGDYAVRTYPVWEEHGQIALELPQTTELASRGPARAHPSVARRTG